MKKIPHDPDELIALVDDNDNAIGKIKRGDAHKGFLHREAYCYLINSKNEVLLQKRADRHIWDHSSAGHFPYNHDYGKAIVREVKEELGIRLKKEDFIEIAKERIDYDFDDVKNHRFVKVFLVRRNIPPSEFKIDRGEVEEIKYFKTSELERLIKTKNITTSAKYLIRKYILPIVGKIRV